MAFSNCPIEKLTIKDGLKLIDDTAFFGCAFEEVRIPGSVTQIGKNAFSYSTSLQRVYIESKQCTIDKPAFFGSTNLLEVHFSGPVGFTYRDVGGDTLSNSYGFLTFYGPEDAASSFSASYKGSDYKVE